jgi:hypothetical protein
MPILIRSLLAFCRCLHLFQLHLLQSLHLLLQGSRPPFKQTTHIPPRFAHRKILHSTVVDELNFTVVNPTSCA